MPLRLGHSNECSIYVSNKHLTHADAAYVSAAWAPDLFCTILFIAVNPIIGIVCYIFTYSAARMPSRALYPGVAGVQRNVLDSFLYFVVSLISTPLHPEGPTELRRGRPRYPNI
jgi:hypothetical protein